MKVKTETIGLQKFCKNGHELIGKYAKFNYCPKCRKRENKLIAIRIIATEGQLRE